MGPGDPYKPIPYRRVLSWKYDQDALHAGESYLADVPARTHSLCLQVFANFDFMKPLIEDMVAADPSSRPDMDEVVSRFEGIRSGLSFWKLRSRLIVRKDGRFINMLKYVWHMYNQATYFAMLLPPMPIPQAHRLS